MVDRSEKSKGGIIAGGEGRSMEQVVTGTVHGNTIVLSGPLPVPDGQRVEVVVRPVPPQQSWGEGIKKSAGGWSAYPEMDEIMEKIHAERKLERR
jgi:hypothetical protein